jgi:hypothetical protein
MNHPVMFYDFSVTGQVQGIVRTHMYHISFVYSLCCSPCSLSEHMSSVCTIFST